MTTFKLTGGDLGRETVLVRADLTIAPSAEAVGCDTDDFECEWEEID
jgi:hypothetical protein